MVTPTFRIRDPVAVVTAFRGTGFQVEAFLGAGAEGGPETAVPLEGKGAASAGVKLAAAVALRDAQRVTIRAWRR